jgi:hypothetical protein
MKDAVKAGLGECEEVKATFQVEQNPVTQSV